MAASGFRKLFWGFLFIMIDFRLQGVDILPDIVGFILFYIGLNALSTQNELFKKASHLSVLMIIVSIFQIYERPVTGSGSDIQFDLLGGVIFIISTVLSLVIVYHLFNGIKEMANDRENPQLHDMAGRRWKQYLLLEIAAFLSFIAILIPPLAVIYIIALLIAAVVITVLMMSFMKKCEQSLGGP